MVLPTSGDSQQGLSHFPHLVRARAGHEHLRQADRAMWGS